MKSTQDGGNAVETIDDTDDSDQNIENKKKTALQKNHKHEFINPFMANKWSQMQSYHISVPDLDNWLKYYKILYWNSADDKKILTARKRDVLLLQSI
jgi:hypothetical protein